MYGVLKRSKKWVSMLLVVTLSFTLLSAVGAAGAKADDISGHWAEANLRKWISNGLLRGYEDGNFKPNKIVTRAEFVALINRSFDLKGMKALSFSDVQEGNWAYEHIATAVKEKYVKGYPDATFRPNQTITREQAALMTASLLQVEAEGASILEQFSDANLLSKSGRDAVAALVQEKLITGFPNGAFHPNKGLTRAEAVTLLTSALSFDNPRTIVYSEAGVYGPEFGVETIRGNVVVTAPDVTLRNVTIAGDLTVSSEVGEGEVYFKGIRVEGESFVFGGGANSVHFEDSVMLRMTVNKSDGSVRIVFAGASAVHEVEVRSPVKLEESFVTDTGFSRVNLSDELPAGSQVDLIGHFEDVSVMSSNIKINIPSGSIETLNVNLNALNNGITLSNEAKVLKLVLNAITELFGEGKISHAVINKGAEKSKFATAPDKIEGSSAAPSTPSLNSGGNSGSVTRPSPTRPTPTPDPSYPVEEPDNSCLNSQSEECKVAALDNIKIGDFTLTQLNESFVSAGHSGFDPNIFNYGIINDLAAPETVLFSATQSTYVKITYNLDILRADGEKVFYYGQLNDEGISHVIGPKDEASLRLFTTSGNGVFHKNYKVVIHKARTIQEAFKVEKAMNYYGTDSNWLSWFDLVAGTVNGENLRYTDIISVYDPNDLGTPISTNTSSIGPMGNVRLQTSDLTSETGSLYITIVRDNKVIAEGNYDYDISPIRLIEEDVGLEIVPFTKEKLFEETQRDLYAYRTGSDDYINMSKLKSVLPTAKYASTLRAGIYSPLSKHENWLVMDQVKTGVTPPGFNGVAPFSFPFELPRVDEGRVRYSGHRSMTSLSDSFPKEVFDEFVYVVFYDAQLNVLGYVVKPVTYDEDHVLEGFIPQKTWQPLAP